MRQITFDPKTGAREERLYSKYFEAAEVVVAGSIGVRLVIDLEKTAVPVLYELEEALGALGPEDAIAGSTIILYFHNLSSEPRSISIASIILDFKQCTACAPTRVQMAPKETKSVRMAGGQVGSYSTECQVPVTFEHDGKRIALVFKAKRQTFEELERKYGPTGTGPDVPWQ